jgi:serine/threonine-protein kinase MRCK
VQLLKDKLEKSRMDSLTDSEETIAEMKRMHEREKLMLLEDNKKLMMDLDSVSVPQITCETCSDLCLFE